MPRLASTGRRPDWDRLYEQASSQAGYFTAQDASEAGFSLPLLQHHLGAGRVERAQRGVFRIVNFPATAEEGLVPTWLWSKREGIFSHETALALHQLSDALPKKVHITVPSAWRKRRLQVGRNVVLSYGDLDDDEREWRGPIPVTTPIRTIVDCSLNAVPKDLVEQAVREGVRRRLFTRQAVKLAVREAEREGRQSGAA